MASCRYRIVPFIGIPTDHSTGFVPRQGPHNEQQPTLPFAVGSPAVSKPMPLHVKAVELQCDAPYKIRFGSKSSEDPGVPGVDDFTYPADASPRLFAVEPGSVFHIVGA